MCRQSWLWGCALMAFGLGLIFGTWIDGGFWNIVLGIGLIVAGCGVAKHR